MKRNRDRTAKLVGPAALAFAPACLLSAALILAQAGTVTASETSDLAAGRSLAEQRCGECHVVAPGSGAGWTNAPSFDAVANRPAMSAGWLRNFIPRPHANMINYSFSQDQVRQIATYIMSLRK